MKVESVWDYPRPPRVEATDRVVRVEFAGSVVVESARALRVLETSHPPVYYVPAGDVAPGVLVPSPTRTFCEYKGVASYFDLVVGDAVSPDAAWTYREPVPGFEALAGYVAFYPGRVGACSVDGETVVAQEGDFYGGWITRDVTGPFKGGSGTLGW